MQIETVELSKKYESKTALHEASVKIDKGKIVGIIGPSGSGKTTLLRLINQLERPSSGKVLFDGKSIEVMSQSEREKIRMNMVLVLQNPHLFQRTVEANIAYGLKLRHVVREEIEERVTEVLQSVGLSEESYRHQFAPTLSAGEAQRVSFARAIITLPDLLMLDEFSANLDPANVKLLEDAVTKYHERTNATIIISTHNFFQAKRIADEIIFIMDGRIIETGNKDDFFSNPKEELTKKFLSGELIC